MEFKKILFLLFVVTFAANGFAQTKSTDKKATTAQQLQTKPTEKKTPPTQQQQDTLKNLSMKAEPALIDTLTNVTLKFKPFKKSVHASYYHNKFNGKRTSSGQRFDNQKYTAAHRKFPFGTILRITNEANGKFVIVEVTDRGPFSRGREIDLTRKAFMEIADNKNSGSMSVTIEEEVKH
jgi:rare lipoprotein A